MIDLKNSSKFANSEDSLTLTYKIAFFGMINIFKIIMENKVKVCLRNVTF